MMMVCVLARGHDTASATLRQVDREGGDIDQGGERRRLQGDRTRGRSSPMISKEIRRQGEWRDQSRSRELVLGVKA